MYDCVVYVWLSTCRKSSVQPDQRGSAGQLRLPCGVPLSIGDGARHRGQGLATPHIKDRLHYTALARDPAPPHRVAFRCSAALVLITGVICCWNFSSRQDATASQLGGGGQKLEGGGGDSDYDEDYEGARGGGGGSPGSPGPRGSATVHRYCTFADVRRRPEIALWNVGNLLSYLGFYMPFVNLVRTRIGQKMSKIN